MFNQSSFDVQDDEKMPASQAGIHGIDSGSWRELFLNFCGCGESAVIQVGTAVAEEEDPVSVKVLNDWEHRVELLGFGSNAAAVQLEKKQLVPFDKQNILFLSENHDDARSKQVQKGEILKLPCRNPNAMLKNGATLGYWLIGSLSDIEPICDALFSQVMLPVCQLGIFYRIAYCFSICHEQNSGRRFSRSHLVSAAIRCLSVAQQKKPAETLVINLQEYRDKQEYKNQVPPFSVYTTIFPELKQFQCVLSAKISNVEYAVNAYLREALAASYCVIVANDIAVGIGKTEVAGDFLVSESGYVFKSFDVAPGCDVAMIQSKKIQGLFSTSKFRDPGIYIVSESELLSFISKLIQPIFQQFKKKHIWWYFITSSALAAPGLGVGIKANYAGDVITEPVEIVQSIAQGGF